MVNNSHLKPRLGSDARFSEEIPTKKSKDSISSSSFQLQNLCKLSSLIINNLPQNEKTSHCCQVASKNLSHIHSDLTDPALKSDHIQSIIDGFKESFRALELARRYSDHGEEHKKLIFDAEAEESRALVQFTKQIDVSQLRSIKKLVSRSEEHTSELQSQR